MHELYHLYGHIFLIGELNSSSRTHMHFLCPHELSSLFLCPVAHCVRPIQNWIQERVRGVSGHQERPKAFPMAHMNRMVIVYKHTVQGKRL